MHLLQVAENNSDRVLSIVSNMESNQINISETSRSSSQSDKTHKSKDDKSDIQGKPKSGRFWKSKKEKFSSINQTKGLRLDFKKKTALRLELKRTKELSRQIQEQLKQKEIDRKERRRENIKKAEENKRKSEIVQVITNSAKLKRIKKKQLRFIQKRDTTKVETNK